MDGDPSAQIEQLKSQQASLLRAVKISLGLLLLTVAVTCIHTVLSISQLREIFSSMMEGPALPAMTRNVLDHSTTLLVWAVFLTLIGFGLLVFGRAYGWSLIMVTLIVVFLFYEWQFVATAMQVPSAALLHSLEGDARP